MSGFRPVSITRDDVELLDAVTESLFRAGENTYALRCGALALRFREAGGFHRPQVFTCDVDESAGMAEIVELNCFSRRVDA